MKWFKNLSRDNLLYGGLIITFIILYGATAFVSWYHAIDLFLIGNAMMLSIILSFVAEVGQASALFSILLTKNKHKFLTWSVMIILTTLQVIGNVYATYDYINKNGGKGVAEFAASILKPFGLADMDPETFKVIIAWILGALLPIIALSMTALVAQNMILRAEEAKTKFDKENQPESIDAKDIISEVSKIRPTQEELDELETLLSKKEPIKKPPVEEVEINKNDILGRTEEEINYNNNLIKGEQGAVWSDNVQQKMLDDFIATQKERNVGEKIISEENEFESGPDTPDEFYDEEQEDLPTDQLTKEEIENSLLGIEFTPSISDEDINEMNQDEYERKDSHQQESDDMDEDIASLTPDIQEKGDPTGEPGAPGWTGSNDPNDVLSEEEEINHNDLIKSELESIITHTNGLVEGMGSTKMNGNTGNGDLPNDSPGLSGSAEISTEAQKEQEERLERLRAIARENLKKK